MIVKKKLHDPGYSKSYIITLRVAKLLLGRKKSHLRETRKEVRL